jgi:lysophospholipase L1-like esterase
MTNRPLHTLFALVLVAALSSCAPARQANAPVAGQPRRAAVAAPPAMSAPTFVYVAIGASDTFGYGVPDPATQGWVPRFAASLPSGTRVVNLGVVGITLHRALAVDLPVALDAHPNLVTVWLAVNDLLGGVTLTAYRADLHTLLSRLRLAPGHPRVLVGNLPDLTLVPSIAARLGADPAGTLARWNAAIAGEAQAEGATLVDLAAQWGDLAAHPEYVGPDGFHPSVAGYARLAAIFAAYAR